MNPRVDFFLTAVRRLVSSVIVGFGSLHAATYYVSPAGSNTAAGTQAAPWQTITYAATKAVAGDIVEVRAGTYAERVNFTRSGTATAPITFRASAGEIPVIDGSTLTPATGWFALFTLNNASYVTVQGFELTGLRTTQQNRVPIGILVSGAGVGVMLLDNHIHHLGTTYTGKNGGDAHGIAVYGNATTPISGLAIRGNHLHDLVLGSSEALVLNGNVTGWIVESNRIYDCNNIGIDAIGHEGICPDPAQDAARNGIIRLNTVYGINSYGNPAYGKNHSAGGIYVDGGRDILIEGNTVHTCDIGIELASEHAGQATSRVHIRNNLLYRNRIGGIFLGGYDTGRGATEDCRIEHNTLFENDSLQYGNGEIQLQFDVRRTSFRHNIIFANSQALIVGNNYTENTGTTFDYNVIHAPGTVRWQWKKIAYANWAAWRTGSSQDAHSLFSDPLFVDSANAKFDLRPKSPAIDLGAADFSPASGEFDHGGNARVNGARTDAGALEFDLLRFSTGGSNEPISISLTDNNASLGLRRRNDAAAASLSN